MLHSVGPPAAMPKWDCDPVEEVEESEAEMAGGGIGEPAGPKEGTFPTTIFPDIAAISGLPMMFCLALLAPDAVFERFVVALAVDEKLLFELVAEVGSASTIVVR